MIHHLRNQRGFVAVPALGLLLVMMAFSAAVFARALSTPDTAENSIDSRKALLAAKAGLRQAVYRANVLDLDLEGVLGDALLGQCAVRTGDVLSLTKVLIGTSWCAGGNEEALGDGVVSDYRMSALLTALPNANQVLTLPLKRHLVATGTSGSVTRRVAVDLVSNSHREASCTVRLLGICISLTGGVDINLALYEPKTSHTGGDLAYVECPPAKFSTLPPGNPAQGCPVVP